MSQHEEHEPLPTYDLEVCSDNRRGERRCILIRTEAGRVQAFPLPQGRQRGGMIIGWEGSDKVLPGAVALTTAALEERHRRTEATP
jgi:hypothetical protein